MRKFRANDGNVEIEIDMDSHSPMFDDQDNKDVITESVSFLSRSGKENEELISDISGINQSMIIVKDDNEKPMSLEPQQPPQISQPQEFSNPFDNKDKHQQPNFPVQQQFADVNDFQDNQQQPYQTQVQEPISKTSSQLQIQTQQPQIQEWQEQHLQIQEWQQQLQVQAKSSQAQAPKSPQQQAPQQQLQIQAKSSQAQAQKPPQQQAPQPHQQQAPKPLQQQVLQQLQQQASQQQLQIQAKPPQTQAPPPPQQQAPQQPQQQAPQQLQQQASLQQLQIQAKPPQQQAPQPPQQQAPKPPQMQAPPPQQQAPQPPQQQAPQQQLQIQAKPPQQQAPQPPQQQPPQHKYLTEELLQKYYEIINAYDKNGQRISIEKIPQDIADCAWDPKSWLSAYDSLRMQGANIYMHSTVCGLRTLAARSIYDLIKRKYAVQVNRNGPQVTVDTLHIGSTHTSFKRVNCIEKVTRPLRYDKTYVHVVNMDTLELTRQLTQKYPGKQVACLNMANQYHPGGSWRTGCLAQEEQLFYRTTLSASLESVEYPLNDYSAVLSCGVSVVREGIDKGLEYYKEDQVWKTNFVSAAAFNLRYQSDPTLPRKEFTHERLIKTRVKIESLIALCANEGMDILVLSAFGCGVFCNPPQYVSAVFRAVIEQYAGHFEHVYFGIKGDPRTENIYYFGATLLGNPPAIVSGPGVLPIDNVDDEGVPPAVYVPKGPFTQSIAVGEQGPLKQVCLAGSNCTIRNPEHYIAHIHPPMCPAVVAAAGDAQGCRDRSGLHEELFSHPKVCIAECEYAYGKFAQLHNEMFVHKPFCSEGSACTKLGDPAHISEFTHPARCSDYNCCKLIHDDEHKKCWTHSLVPACKDGIFCPKFGDHEHMSNFAHPFKPLSPTPFNYIPTADADKYSQMCPEGPYCTKLSDKEHMKSFIHIGKPCKIGTQCKDMSEEHLLTHRHPDGRGPVRMLDKPAAYPSRSHLFYPCGDYILPVMSGALPDYDANVANELAYMQGRLPPNSENDYRGYVNWVKCARPTILLRYPNEIDVYTELGYIYSLYTLLEEIPKATFLTMFKSKSHASEDDCKCVLHIIRQYAQEALGDVKKYPFNTEKLQELLSGVVNMEPEKYTLPQGFDSYMASITDLNLQERLKNLGETIGSIISNRVHERDIKQQIEAGTAGLVEACLGQVPFYDIYNGKGVLALDRNIMFHQSAFALRTSVAKYPEESLRECVNRYATHPACDGWSEMMAEILLERYPKYQDFPRAWNNNPDGRFANPTLYLPGKVSFTYVSYAATPTKEGKRGSDGDMDFSKVAYDASKLTEMLMKNDKEQNSAYNGATFALAPANHGNPDYVQCPVFVNSVLRKNGGKAYLCFGTGCSEFSLVISSVSKSDPVKIQVRSRAATISFGSQTVHNSEFNARVCYDKPYVFYMVEITPRSITLKHYGFSAVLNQETLRLECGEESFAGLKNVYVLPESKETGLFYNMKCYYEDRSLKLRHFAKVTRNEDGELELSKSLRYCTYPFECPIEFNKGHPDHVRHIRAYKHVCKMGMSCKEIGDPDHCRMYTHLVKEVCRDPNCGQNMYNPEHRLMYHHPNYYDFMLRCHNGPGCPSRMEPQHAITHHHTGFTIGSVKSVLKRLEEMKGINNTKK